MKNLNGAQWPTFSVLSLRPFCIFLPDARQLVSFAGGDIHECDMSIE